MENNMLKRDAYNELLELLNDGLNVKEVRELIFRAENKVINAGKTLVDRDPLNNLKNDDIDKAEEDKKTLDKLEEQLSKKISSGEEILKDEVSEIINEVIRINDYWRKYMPKKNDHQDTKWTKPLYDIDKINDFLKKNNMEKIERTEDHEMLANSGNKHGVDASHFQSYASVNDSSLDNVTNVHFAEKSNVDKESNEIESDNLHLMGKMIY